MSDIQRDDEALERKRARDRQTIAAKRAAMTPEQRAAARRAHDATYRDRHREQRREADRRRWRAA